MIYKIVAILLLACASSLLSAQESVHEFEVRTILFEGNETLNDDLLQNVMLTRESPSWIWKFLYKKISEKLGEKPEYFDPLTFDQDYSRLQQFYQDQGFFRSRIDTLIRFNDNDKTVDLTIQVNEGPRSAIDTIEFIGFEHLPSILTEEVDLNPQIKVGDPYIMENVVAERVRILNAFSNNGFIDVRVDSVVTFLYDATNNVKVVFAFTRGNRYLFGDINVRQDSTVVERVEQGVILRHLDFKKGDFFSEAKKVDSERNLNRLGIFEASRVEQVIGAKPDSSLEIPMSVFVRPRPFQELVPEIGVNDENNAFNIQVGLGYNNRNLFGGARNFSTRARLQIQSIQDVNFSRAFSKTGLRDSSVLGTAEVSAQLIQPYFFNNKTTLTPTLSILIEKKHKLYYNPIISGRIGVTSQTARYTTGFLEWSLERIGYEPIDPVVGRLYFDSLSRDRRPQLNSILTFTLQRDKRNDLFFPSSGFLHSGTIEEAGLLPSAFGGLFGSELPYSKYIKVLGLGQWYWDATKNGLWIWALRLRGGIAELYGNSPAPVPINRRFFAGGSGSVRGWKARDLGALPDPSEGGTALFEGNIEGRWQPLRSLGNFWFLELNKVSFVFFYDVGNVWTDVKRVRVNEFAMATGFGIRYATVAGPIRFDVGLRVYDPAAPDGRRWITQKRFFAETLSNFIPHIGIGHAF